MKNLSWQARLYIFATLLCGGLLFLFEMTQVRLEAGWLLVMACVIASVTQVLKVTGATSRSSYNNSWMVFGFAFFILGAPATVAVVVVCHLVEWIRHKYSWYIQLFNISSYIFATVVAGLISAWIDGYFLASNLTTALRLLAAMATFTLVNHLMVGIVIWLARGESLVKSGVFEILTLMIDFSLLCLGLAAALIWTLNPFAIVFTVFPLYLIYSTLRVPALVQQTDTDPKTGLQNDRAFSRAMHKALENARKTGAALTVVFGDIDLLRNINNTYGHMVGDEALIMISRIMRERARPSDVVSRFGGEEFAILMPDITLQDALPYIEGIRVAIQAMEIQNPSNHAPIHVTMSFGIAGQELPNLSAYQIMNNADVALYHSKQTGRDRVTLYSSSILEKTDGTIEPRPRVMMPKL